MCLIQKNSHFSKKKVVLLGNSTFLSELRKTENKRGRVMKKNSEDLSCIFYNRVKNIFLWHICKSGL